jgi:hypothetical protein
MFESDVLKWAKKLFGKAKLKDKRRTKRLVNFAAEMAAGAGKSIVKACKNAASIEGAYRFIENDYICPKAIAQAGFDATAEEAKTRPLVLAIEDTTSLSFTHSVAKELGDNPASEKASCKGRSLFEHSILMLDADKETVIGLGHKQNYIREKKFEGTAQQRVQRPKEEKESYRWEESSKRLDDTFGETDNILHICDREADSYEYMDQHFEANRRFIVRSAADRQLTAPVSKLHMLKDSPIVAEHTVKIAQKGNGLVEKDQKLESKGKKLTQKEKKSANKINRPARIARVGVSFHEITIKKPARLKNSAFEELTLNVVICRELNNPDEDTSLCWYIYTNEEVNNVEDARRIVRYYELRWRIEDFHKVWKTEGTQVEKLRLQTRANMERMSTILVFVAIRLMQLKEMVENQEEAKKQSCELMFSPLEWQMLWLKMEQKNLPKETPSLHWAYYALSKLGGWYDSKRTGRVSVKTIWEGWVALMMMLDGHRIMEQIASQK